MWLFTSVHLQGNSKSPKWISGSAAFCTTTNQLFRATPAQGGSEGTHTIYFLQHSALTQLVSRQEVHLAGKNLAPESPEGSL